MTAPRELRFTPHGRADYEYWQHAEPHLFDRLTTLIADVRAHPDSGMGNPIRLSHTLAGLLSRRLSGAHRLIYSVDDDGGVTVVAARYHGIG